MNLYDFLKKSNVNKYFESSPPFERKRLINFTWMKALIRKSRERNQYKRYPFVDIYKKESISI